jgi:WD40 repeat protein
MSPDKAAAPALDELLREACAALDGRLRSGARARTEDLLAEHPELASNAEYVLELAYTEYVTRDALGEPVEFDEWFERFPALRQDLRELFEVHRFVEQSAADTLASHGGATKNGERADLEDVVPSEIDNDRRFGNYELLEEIGRGGMGVVYKARQLGLRRIVALKLILAGEHAGKDRCERFQAEAETVARLAHPNIVQIHEVGAEDGRPFLSLEYVERGSLDRQRFGEPWPAREAAELLVTLARAMQHAHERGIIHRDLKPANVLMTADGVPKITDFGLAKNLSDEQSGQTATGAMIGTPCYMAPEQALGNSRDSGAAADVYALGAILYELLTGRPPFRGASLLETLEQVRTQEPVGPRQLIGKLPRDLETICLKCLQKQPQHRYASAAALADDLQRFLELRPIQARPVSIPERVVRWSARNRMLAALAASLIVLVGVALVVGPVVAYQQAAMRKEVQRQLVATKASLLAARSRMSADDAPQRSVLLAIEGLELLRTSNEPATVTNEQALRDALARTSGVGLAGHRGSLSATTFTPDGNTLITAGADGTVRLWPVATPGASKGWTAHEGAVRAVSVSKSGRWLVTAGDDQVARVWDLRAEKVAESAVELAGFQQPVVVALYSPEERWLLLGDRSGLGKLYAIAEAQPPALTAEFDLKLPIVAAAFSPDGKWLAVGGVDKSAHVWPLDDAGLGAERNYAGHEGAIAALAFDPRRPRLATASADRTVRVWNLDEAPDAATPVVLPHQHFVSCVGISADGRWLVSGSLDGTARRWDLERADWSSESETLDGAGDRIFALAMSDDSRWLATAARDKTIRVWDLSSSDPGATARTLRGHDDAVQAVAFNRDGTRLASASADGAARLYDLAAGLPAAGALYSASRGATRIQQIALSPSGRWLVGCGNDAQVQLRDRHSNQASITLPHDHVVRHAAFSADDRWLVTVEMAPTPRPPKLWDLQQKATPLTPMELRGHTQAVECVAIDPRSRWVVTGSQVFDGEHDNDGAVRRWSLVQAKLGESEVIAQHGADVMGLGINRASDALISLDMSGAARFIELTSAMPSTGETWLPGHESGVLQFASFPDGQRFVTVDLAGTLRLWRRDASKSETPSAIVLWNQKPHVRKVAVSDDGNWLAAVDARGRVLAWRTEMATQNALVPNAPHYVFQDAKSRAGVLSCAISPDSRRLAAFAQDGQVRIWGLDAPSRAPIVIAAHRHQVQSALFTPDGRTLITAGYDGAIHEWPLEVEDLVAHARQVAGRSLSEEELRQNVGE